MSDLDKAIEILDIYMEDGIESDARFEKEMSSALQKRSFTAKEKSAVEEALQKAVKDMRTARESLTSSPP